MYELGFDKTPEERVGALFWRMHRCARIIFSLKFHMGLWSPQECVDFLVDQVGHERANADGRGAPLVPGVSKAALSGGVPARRPAAARAAQGARRLEADDEQAVPRRDHAAGQHADRADPPGRSRSRSSRATWTSTGSSTAICRPSRFRSPVRVGARLAGSSVFELRVVLRIRPTRASRGRESEKRRARGRPKVG